MSDPPEEGANPFRGLLGQTVDPYDEKLTPLRAIGASFVDGLQSLFGTMAINARSMAAILQDEMVRKLAKAQGLDVAQLSKIDEDSFSRHERFVEEMELVYATALFDSFLSDTLRLCALKFPESFLKKNSISVAELARRKPSDILNEQAYELAKSNSYGSFLERISFLESKLGLKFGLDEKERNGLLKWSRLRNAIIHDKSIADLRLDDNGQIKIRGRQVERVGGDPVREATRTYRLVVAKIYSEVGERCAGDGLRKHDLDFIVYLVDPEK